MKNFQLFLSVKKNNLYPAFFTDGIMIFRVIFYIVSAVILIKLSLQVDYSSLNREMGFLQLVLYFLMGIIAATIANSTGAGGGIVFLPIFISLGFTPLEAFSTSIAIQCFGMTSGALAWISYRKKEKVKYAQQWEAFYPILSVSAFSSCVGIISTQYWMSQSPIDIKLLFALFSLAVGSLILVRTLRVKKEYIGRIHVMSKMEIIGLVVASTVGGAITAWLSIGVGEILLIYLIFLGIRINVAVAIAVCVSAISVLIALPFHASSQSIGIDVLVFAAPGALIGGVIARSLAIYLGMHKLKMAASSWIILSSIPHLVSSIR